MPVIIESRRLRSDLETARSIEQSTVIKSAAMIHELSAAGTSTDSAETTDEDVIAREDLDRHLRYWLAIRRVAASTFRAESSARVATEIEPFDPVEMDDLEPGQLLELATSDKGTGANSVRISGERIESGVFPLFVIDACEVFDASIADVEVEEFIVSESSISSSNLVGIRSIAFSGQRSRFTRGSLDITLMGARDNRAPTIDLSHTVFSGTEIMLNATDGVVRLDRAVFSVEGKPSRLQLTARESSFADANLAGAHFANCDFGSISVEEALISGAVFEGCRIKGRPLELEDLKLAGDFDEASNSSMITS